MTILDSFAYLLSTDRVFMWEFILAGVVISFVCAIFIDLAVGRLLRKAAKGSAR